MLLMALGSAAEAAMSLWTVPLAFVGGILALPVLPTFYLRVHGSLEHRSRRMMESEA